ncbi:MAG: VWA domain-containing protein, partial [Candidatus Acidiferrales bacterium]
MRARLIVILFGSCLLAAVMLVAQDIPSDEYFWGSRPFVPEPAAANAIRVQSDLVEVPTVVRDGQGKPVGNLKKGDFLLFDNGAPQTISTFTVLGGPGGPLPLVNAPNSAPTQARYVALFFDDVNTTLPNLVFAREGAIKFIGKGLDPGERVGIFTVSAVLTLDFTDDVQKLLEALAKLRLFPRMPDQAPLACPALGKYQAWVIKHDPGGATLEFQSAVSSAKGCGCKDDPGICARSEADLVVGSAERWSVDTLESVSFVIHHLGEMPGHRVLVLASSGFLALSLGRELEKVVEAALRANVIINSLSSSGVGRGIGPLSDPLANLAAGTGGQFIHDNNDIG